MIVFDRLWKMMDDNDMTTYQLRERCDLDRKTVGRLEENRNIETKTLNKICAGLSCKIEDIAEYIVDDEEQDEIF